MEDKYISDIVRIWYPAMSDGRIEGKYDSLVLPYKVEHFQTEELLRQEGEHFRLEFFSAKLKNPRLVFFGQSLAWMEFKIKYDYPKSYTDSRSGYRLVHHKQMHDLFSESERYSDIIVVGNKIGVDKAVGEIGQSIRQTFMRLRKDNKYKQYFT